MQSVPLHLVQADESHLIGYFLAQATALRYYTLDLSPHIQSSDLHQAPSVSNSRSAASQS